MKTWKLTQFCAWSLGFLLLCNPSTDAQSLSGIDSFGGARSATLGSVSSPTQTTLDPNAVIQELSRSRVIYLGETHDSEADHRAQLEIIRALHRRNPNLAIGMEMFQRQYQSVIDRYLSGKITEQQLQELSEYQKRWSYPWEFYAPILRFAKLNQIPVVALNAPSEVTRKVARQGLNSLTVAERRFIPPFSEIRPEPQRYRDRLREIYDGIHHGKSNSRGFESFFLAQVLWDETMADSVSQFLKANSNQQMIVLAGQGHVIYGDGIPSRVARRMKTIKQSIVLLNPPDEFKTEVEPAIADYFWMLGTDSPIERR